jgi:transposase
MKDFTGKTIFVGIDVHKKTYSVTAVCDGIIAKRDTLKASPNLLIAYLKKRFGSGRIKTAYESGFCGFHLHRALEAADIENIVVHAAGIEVSNDRVKTDKRDSVKIAMHLSQGRLQGIHIPTAEREDYRTITRLRDTFSKEKTRIACQIKSLLFLHGLIVSDDKKKVSPSWIKNLSNLTMTPGVKFAVEKFAIMWLEFNAKIKEIDIEMKAQAAKDSALDTVYQSAPGIGATSARVLANELGDLQQFKNERQLSSYVGFTPSEHSSGEHTRQGHITKQGKPILRKILIQSSWTAVRYDQELQSVFERISVKSGAKRAIVAVARRLIGRIRACFRKEKLYEVQKVERPTIRLRSRDQEKRLQVA